jgi:hypothetical protein
MLCLRNIVDSESATETQYEDARGSFESNIHKPSTQVQNMLAGFERGSLGNISISEAFPIIRVYVEGIC